MTDHPPAPSPELKLDEFFGPIDVYLFDQLLRGRIQRDMRIFDAGCGGGRNLVYFLRTGFEVCGADRDPSAIAAVRQLASSLAVTTAPDAFRAEPLEELSFPAASQDVVICNAVLHFAKSDAQFQAMLEGAWRVLRPGGLFFARLASSIGIECLLAEGEGRRFRLPDGSDRYLVDEALLLELTDSLGGSLLDPIKTTNVQNLRCMTTWVMRHDG